MIVVSVIMFVVFTLNIADPYVKVIVLHHQNRVTKWKTAIKKNTLSPVFNEQYLQDIANMDMKDLQIEVVVMDYDRFSRNHVIGSIMFGPYVENEAAKSHWKQAIDYPNTSCTFWHVIRGPDTRVSPHRGRSRSPSPRSCVKPSTTQ